MSIHNDYRLRIRKNTNCKLLFHPTSKVGKLLHSTSLNISIGESLDLFSQDGQPTTRLRIPCAVKHCVSQALCPVHDFIARKQQATNIGQGHPVIGWGQAESSL